MEGALDRFKVMPTGQKWDHYAGIRAAPGREELSPGLHWNSSIQSGTCSGEARLGGRLSPVLRR